MKLIHVCPNCKKEYERDCTPEPDLPCNECQYLKYFSDCKLVCDEYKDAIYLEERLQIGL